MQPKTELVKEMLVRYIRDNNLTVGSKMPSQKELRRYCGTGGSTIIAAMEELSKDGVVEIQPRVGVFVLTPNADGHTGRRIGVISKIPVFNPFQAILLEYLEFFMRNENCRTVKFWRTGSEYDTDYGFDEYPGLKRMMLAGEIDALIIIQQHLAAEIRQLAEKLNIPVLGYAADNMHKNVIVHDHEYMTRESVRKLKEKGCRRPVFFSITTSCYKHLFQVYKEEMEKFYPDQLDVVSPKNCFAITNMDVRENNLEQLISDRIAEIADGPEELYPDCLILADDIIACWAIEIMWKTRSKWHPEFLMLRNKQLPLHITPPKFGCWTLNIAGEAKIIAEKTLHMLRSGEREFPAIYTKPVFTD